MLVHRKHARTSANHRASTNRRASTQRSRWSRRISARLFGTRYCSILVIGGAYMLCSVSWYRWWILQEMLAECFLELAINSIFSCQDCNYRRMMGVRVVKEKAKKTLLEVPHVLTTEKLQEDILDVWSVGIARIPRPSFNAPTVVPTCETRRKLELHNDGPCSRKRRKERVVWETRYRHPFQEN